MTNKNLIITIVLVVLVIISIVQAFQLTSLKSSIQEGNIKTASAGVNTQSSEGSGSPSLPPSLENLPGMVGGC